MDYNNISINPYIKSHLELQREITLIELAWNAGLASKRSLVRSPLELLFYFTCYSINDGTQVLWMSEIQFKFLNHILWLLILWLLLLLKMANEQSYTPIPHRPLIATIFFLFGGIHEVPLNFFLQSWCSTSQSRFRNDVVTNIRGNRINSAGIAQAFITISKITLEHAARKLRNQLRIS